MVEACATGGRQNPLQGSQGLPAPPAWNLPSSHQNLLPPHNTARSPFLFFPESGLRVVISTSSTTRNKCLLYHIKILRNFVVLCNDTASHPYIGHWHLLAKQEGMLTVANKLTCLLSQFPPHPSSSEHLHPQNPFHCQNATELCDMFLTAKQCHCFSASLATSSPTLSDFSNQHLFP